MKFTLIPKLAFALTAISAVNCAPAPDTSPNPAAGAKKLMARNNDCYDSSFENRSSEASPLVADCEQLARNIAGDGSWNIGEYDSWRTLATYGTCAFGAVAPWGSIGGWVGNEDIRDLIRDSITKFRWFDKVGSWGEMDCCCASATIEWGIYHT